MEPLNRDRFSQLQDVFLSGGLNEPPKVWVRPVTKPHLSLKGQGVHYQDGEWILDYGSVPAIGPPNKRQVIIENAGQRSLNLDLEVNEETWLEHKWKSNPSRPCLKAGGDRAVLEISFQGKEIKEQDLTSLFLINATTDKGNEKAFPLRVKINAHTRFAYGRFDFNGKAVAEPHDFGVINPVEKEEKHKYYRLSIENIGAKPLEAKLDTSAEWLAAETINIEPSRNGLSFRVSPGETGIIVIRPMASMAFMGQNKGEIILRSNDIRKRYKKFSIPFHCVQEIKDPHITFEKPESVEIVPNHTYSIDIPIFNQGKSEAQVFVTSRNPYIQPQPTLQVPSAVGSEPGEALLPVTIQGDSDIPPGAQTINLELKLINENQKPLYIPIEIYVIKIEWDPESLDFGDVNLGETPSLPVTFKASDDRELFIGAKPEPALQDDLSVKIVNDCSIEVILEDKPISSNKDYEGPGIIVYDYQLGYEERLFAKFRRTTPIFAADTMEIDMGTIVGGADATGSFELSNKGDGVLSVEMRPDSEELSIEGPLLFNIPPEKSVGVNFTFDLKEKVEEDEPIRYSVFIKTNDLSAEPEQKILIQANILRPEGKLCTNCTLVAPLNDTYCPLCGHSLEDALPVSKQGLMFCRKCKRKYKTESPFCSQDGKRLKKIDV